MLTLKTIRSIALSFPGTEELPHFELISFRVDKKIFATLNLPMKRCTVKFNAEYQDIFTSLGKGKIYPVPNAWGKQGWTTIELTDMKKEFLEDAFRIAWRLTAPKKFKKIYPDWFIDIPED